MRSMLHSIRKFYVPVLLLSYMLQNSSHCTRAGHLTLTFCVRVWQSYHIICCSSAWDMHWALMHLYQCYAPLPPVWAEEGIWLKESAPQIWRHLKCSNGLCVYCIVTLYVPNPPPSARGFDYRVYGLYTEPIDRCISCYTKTDRSRLRPLQCRHWLL